MRIEVVDTGLLYDSMKFKSVRGRASRMENVLHIALLGSSTNKINRQKFNSIRI